MNRTSEKRRRILDAALKLALRQGSRATTMEAIAREAGIAKPTLYGYFGDKEAVFDAVVADLVAAARIRFDEALAMPGDVAPRIGKALAEKYKLVFRQLAGSPHADEFQGQANHGGTAWFREVEVHMEASIARELDAAGVVRPRQMTRLLLAAASGVVRRATAASEIGPALRLIAERLIGPELRR